MKLGALLALFLLACSSAHAQTFDPKVGSPDIPVTWMPALITVYGDLKKSGYDLECYTISMALHGPMEHRGKTYTEVYRVGTGYTEAYRAALFSNNPFSVDAKRCGATHMYYVDKSGKIILKETKKN